MKILSRLVIPFLLGAVSACTPCPWEDTDLANFETFSLTAEGPITPGATVDVEIELNFFELRGGDGHDHSHDDHAHADENPCPGGHVHVYLNDLMENPVLQMTSSQGELTIPSDVEAGEHTLFARLHNTDHTIHLAGGEEVIETLTLTVDSE